MLDHFLDVVYRDESSRQQSVKLASHMKNLPEEMLLKLISGEEKLAFGGPEGHCGEEWLEKYKDTPLFQEAMALEKADLENEVGRSQADAARPQMDHFYQTQDQIRVQKKMLDLKLVEQGMGPGLPMQAGGQLPDQLASTAQGAGALGDVAAEGASDGAMTGKTAAPVDLSKAKGFANRAKELLSGDRTQKLKENVRRAQGRLLPHLQKGIEEAGKDVPTKHVQHLTDGRMTQALGKKSIELGKEWMKSQGARAGVGLGAAGAVAGAVKGVQHLTKKKESSAEDRFLKAAFDMKALGNNALAMAKRNPTAVGAGLGALGGAVTGAVAAPTDQHGNKHYLTGALAGGASGALLGAGAGHAAGGIHSRMQGGKSLVDAAKGYGGDSLASAGKKMRQMKDTLMEGVRPAQQTLPGL